MANNSSNRGTLIILAAIVIVGVAAYAIMNMPDRRTPGQKVGDAIDAVDQGKGISGAARELEDRTPGERLGDAVKDAGQEIKESTDGN